MNSFTDPGNLRYLEELYESYRKNPESVDRAWQDYFAELARDQPASSNGHGSQARQERANSTAAPAPVIASTVQDQLNDMIKAFRTLGHRAARLDPLGLQKLAVPELDPAYYGFTPERMEQLFPSVGLHWTGPLPLREIVQRLQRSYCGPIGVEFMHIEERGVREWVEQRIESNDDGRELSRAQRLQILTQLIQAAGFDEFLRSKFAGAKSFSLEGAESLVALLKFAVEKSARDGTREIVLAMAHRGRLNVLVNVIGKTPREVFREFIDAPGSDNDAGDVKYHLGYSGDIQSSAGRKVHLSL